MRTAIVVTAIVGAIACASSPTAGPLGDGTVVHPRISAIDSTIPPRHATVQIDQPEHVALLLIAPGHSATLLFPGDSSTPNRFEPGAHQIPFQIPEAFVEADTTRMVSMRGGRDTVRLGRTRQAGTRVMQPLPAATPTYLLVVTSPQQLSFSRIVEKTAGVSIPMLDSEALNAVGKAIKSTLPAEPRQWAGYYQLVALRRQR